MPVDLRHIHTLAPGGLPALVCITWCKLYPQDLSALACMFQSKPEKRGRKPGTRLNGDRRVESMGGIAAGGWWEQRGRGGGAGMVRLCWVWPWGALAEKDRMCRKKERREEVWER